MTTGAFKRIDVLALVLQATREEGLKDRIVEVRTAQFTVGFAKFQCRAVSAVQEVGEVRCRKNELPSLSRMLWNPVEDIVEMSAPRRTRLATRSLSAR